MSGGGEEGALSAAAASLAAALGLPSSQRPPSPIAPRPLRALPARARWEAARAALAVASGLRALASLDGAHLPDPSALARALGAPLAPLLPPPPPSPGLGRTAAVALAVLVVDGVCCVCDPWRLLRECALRLEALRRRGGGGGGGGGDGGAGDDGDDVRAPLLVCLGGGGAPCLAPPEVHERVCAQLEVLQSVLEVAFDEHCRGRDGGGGGGAVGGGGGDAPPPSPPALPVVPDILLSASAARLPALPTLNGWLLGYPVVYVVGADAGAGPEEQEAAGRRASAALQQAAASGSGGGGGGGLRLLRAVLPCAALPPEPGDRGGDPSPLWQCSVPVEAVGGERAVDELARACEARLRARLVSSSLRREAGARGGGGASCWAPASAARVEVRPASSGVAIVL